MLLLSAVPIAVLMNALRIGVIGVLVDRYGIGQAEGFLHFFEGWIIFLSCIGLLFLMVLAHAAALRRPPAARRGDRPRLHRPRAPSSPASATIAALARADRRDADDRRALGRLELRARRARPSPAPRDPFALFPLSLGGWEGSPAALAPNVEETLGADDYLSAFFRAPGEAEGVDLFVSYYASQTRGEAIHSPAVCLPGAGWEVAAIRPAARSTLPGTRFGTLHAEPGADPEGAGEAARLLLVRGPRPAHDQRLRRQVPHRGRRPDPRPHRRRPRPGDHPDRRADGEAAADARLQRFLAASVDRLPRFIPE